MLKNLKRAAAIVLSFAMAIQFGLANSYYVNAEEEPVEPQQEQTTTVENNSEVQEEDANEVAVPETKSVELSYVAEDGTVLQAATYRDFDLNYGLNTDSSVMLNFDGYTLKDVIVNNSHAASADQVSLNVTSELASVQFVYKKVTTETDHQTTEQPKTEEKNDDDAEADPDSETEVKEELPEYPAFIQSETAGNVVVHATAAEGVLPRDSKLVVKRITRKAILNAVEETVSEKNKEVESAVALDITIQNKDGVEIQPNGLVNISFENVAVTGEEVNVYHVTNDANTVTEVATNTQSFDTNHFSIYVITGENQVPLTTFNFVANGTTVSTQIVKSGDTLIAPTAPDMIGQAFVGWVDEAGNSFTGFGKQAEITETTTCTITARYEAALYVYFLNPDGSQIMRTEKVGDHEAHDFTTVSYEVDSTHKLVGWAAEANGTTNIADKISVPADQTSVNVYAIIKEGYWVSFNSDGGSIVDSQFVLHGDKLVLGKDTKPTKPGYTFDGWYNGLTKVENGATVTSPMTLTAHWKAAKVSYTVIHWWENADDNEYSFHESETKTGLTGTEVNATAKSYNGFTAQPVTKKTIKGDGSTIVSVYYKRNVYEVKFYSYTIYNWLGRVEKSSEEYVDLRITAKYGQDISKKWPTKSGSSTWSTTDDDYNGPFQVNIATMPLGGAKFYGPKTGSGSETAYYYVEVLPGEPSEVTKDGIRYKLDHKDTSPGTGYSVSKEDQYPLTGYTFNEKVSTRTGKSYDDAKFYYTRNSYKIKFINKGKVDKSVDKKYQQSISNENYTPARPSSLLDYYEFDGWYDNELCEGEKYVFNGKTMPAQNITLYAKWTAKKISLTYNLNNPEGTVDKGTKKVAAGTIASTVLPSASAIEGYSFAGWYVADENGHMTNVAFNANDAILKDTNVIGKWLYNGKLTVKYVADGVEAPKDNNVYAGGAKATVASGVTKEGKKFLGWQLDDNVYQPGQNFEVNKDLADDKNVITLIAVFGDSETSAILNYHPGNGSGEDQSVAILNNVEVTLKNTSDLSYTAPGKDYYFAGWATSMEDARKGNAKYAVGEKVRVNADSSNDLYATWVKKTVIEVTANSNTLPYNGEERKVEGFSVTSGYEVTGLTAVAKGINCGTYETKITGTAIVTKDGVDVTDKVIVNKKNGTLTITPKSVTVTGNNGNKVYGEADPELTATVAGTLGKDKVKYTVARESGEDVGHYSVIPTGEEIQGNYKVTYKNGDFEITKAEKMTLTPELTGKDAEKVYDGQPLSGGATASVKEGTTITYSTDDGKTWSETLPSITNVGTLNVKAKAENKNYKDVTVDYTLTVKHRNVTVTGNNGNKVYGEADPELTATVAGTLGKDKVKYTVARESGEDVGHYSVIPTGEEIQGNYKVTYKNGDFEITKAEKMTLTPELTGKDAEKVYDGQPLSGGATASVKEGTTITYSTDDGKTWSETLPSITNVGTLNVKAKAENKNYKDVTVDYTLTVKHRNVTVTGNNGNKVYGEADPELTATVAGTLGKDKVKYTVARESGEDVGHYSVIPTGEEIQGNYKVTYKNGDFEITKAEKMTLTPELTGKDAEKVYDGQPLSGGATASVKEGTTITYSTDDGKTWSETLPSITNVGTLNVKAKAENKNYKDVTVDYTLTVKHRNVTVTGNNGNKVYGEADPELTATVAGTLGKDKVKYTVARESGEDVGHYSVIPTGEEIQGNYKVTYKNGDFEITKAEKMTLTPELTGKDAEKVYDGQPLSGGATASVKEGTTITYSTDDGKTWSETLPSITNVGTLNVKAKAENKNYKDVTVDYTLTVKHRNVTVTGNNGNKVYGEADPELTATVAGTLGKDKVKYTVARESGEDVGHYSVIPTGEEIQGNYKVTYKNGDFEITKAEKMTLTPELTGKDAEKVYDGQPLSGGATASVKEGTTITYSTDDGKTWSETLPSITNVGTLNVKAKAENKNYKDVTVDYTLTVKHRNVTVTGNNGNKVYGEADPELTATVAGTLGKDKVKYTVARESGEDVGHYSVIPTGEEIQGNYKVTYKNGDFEITKAEKMTLTPELTGKDAEKVYDGQPLSGGATASVKEGTTITYSTDDGKTWSETLPSITNVGTLNVKAKAENKNYKDVTVDYTLTVKHRNVTVTGNNGNKVYGEADPELTATVAGTLGKDKVKYTVARESGEDVGHYSVIPTGEEIQGNYKVTYKNGDFEITKAEKMTLTPELTGKDAEKVYDGQPLSGGATASVKEGTTITYSTDDGKTWSETLPSITNVGTLNVKAKAENKNYKDVTVDYTLTVKHRNVTVTGNNGNKVYGEADPELTATVAGTLGKDKVKYTVARESGEDVGHYSVIPTGEEIQGNYKVTYKNGDFEITKAEKMTLTPELTGKDAEKVYDGQPLSGGATASVKEGTTITYSTDDGKTWSETLPSITNVGTLNVKAKAENKNYKDVTVDYTLTVKHRNVTVTGNNGNKVYGEADPELTATVAGTLGKDKVKYTVARESGEDVGHYSVIPTGEEIQGNYKVTYKNGDFEITKAEKMTLTPELTGKDAEKVYDGQPLSGGATASVKEGTTITYSTDDGKTWSETLPSITNVGTLNVKAKAENKNYKDVTVDYTLTVKHRNVTVTGNNGNKVYGEADPELTATVAGTLGKDKVKYTVARESGEDVGHYSVIPTGEEIQGNYKVTYKNGDFEITKAEKMTLTPELTGKDAEKVYDGQPLSGGATASVKEGTTITYSTDDGKTWSETLPSITNVGTLNVKAKAENKNYKDVTVDYTLTVKHRNVTVTGNNGNKVYGEADPELTATVAGTLGKDKVKYTVARESGEDVGHYSVIPTGEEIQGNYKVTYKNGDFEITKAEKMTLTPELTGKDAEKVYDGQPLSGGATASVKEGTTITYSTDDGKTWSETLPSITNVGTLNVKAKAENKNYKDVTVDYTLTVKHRNVTVTGNNGNKVYGEADPELTATVAGTLGKDKVKYTVARESGEDVGHYSVIPTGEEIQGNYKVTYKNGDFEITKAEKMTLTPELTGKDAEKVYDGQPLSGGATASVKEGTTITYSTDDGKTWSETLPSITNVGTLNVKAKAENKNYKDVTVDYTLTVKHRNVTVTGNNGNKVYGEADPELTATVAGTLGKDKVKYTVARESGEDVGHYSVIPTGEEIQGNYKVTYVAGTLTITAQSIDPGTDPDKPNPDYTGAKVNNPSDEVYDGKEHKWIPTVTDKADKKLKVGTDYTVEYSTKNFKDVGTIDVTITGIKNYTGKATRTYSITPKTYTVTTESDSKVYDGTALTAGGKVSGIVKGETVDFTITGSQTSVGTSDNTYELNWTGSAKESNYKHGKDSIGTLTVKAKSIVPDGPNTPDEKKTGITVSDPSDSKYDGKEHREVLTVQDTKTDKKLVADKDYSVTYSDDLVNAGTVTITIEGIGNYTGSFTKTYEITKRSVTLTSATASKTYDGQALTSTSITVSGDGFVKGEGATYNVTGTQTEVGNSANAFEYKLNENTLASNYDITKVVGTLTVTRDTTPVTPAPTPTTPSVPPVVQRVVPTPTPVPEEKVEEEQTPKAEPKEEEKVEEDYTPKATQEYYWALINLICAIVTVLFGLLLLISKRHKDEDDEEEDDETKQQQTTTNEDEEKEQEKKRGVFTRVLAVLIAIVSVVFFLVTEDMSLAWTWTDQWTIWMVVIGLVQIVVFFVGRKWKNVDNDDDDEEAQQA